MALNLRNIGQRLLDATTLDEKFGSAISSTKQYFRPKTGTLATTGRKWAQELAAKPVDVSKPILRGVSVAGVDVTPDMLLGGMRGATSALTGFTGIENKLPQFKTFTSYQPQTTAGKVSQVAGAIGGSLVPASPINVGAKLISKAPLISLAQKQLGTGAGKLIAKGGISKLAGTGVANLSQGLPYTAAFAGLQKIAGQDYGASEGAKDIAFDLASGALPVVGPLMVGMTRGQGKKEIASALRNEPGIMSLAGRFRNLTNLDVTKYIDESAKLRKSAEEILQEVSPDTLKALNKYVKDPETWTKQAVAALEDKLVYAKNPDVNLGFQARGMKKVAPKLSVEGGYKTVGDWREVPLPEGFENQYKNIKTGEVKHASELPKEVQSKLSVEPDLLTEARKYKSAEEFVKAVKDTNILVDPSANVSFPYREVISARDQLYKQPIDPSAIEHNAKLALKEVKTIRANIRGLKDMGASSKDPVVIKLQEQLPIAIKKSDDLWNQYWKMRKDFNYQKANGEKNYENALTDIYNQAKGVAQGGLSDNANQFLSSVRTKYPDNNEKQMIDYAKKIADIRGSKIIDTQDIAEALQYSRKAKGFGEDVGFNSLFSKDRTGTEFLDRMKEVGVKDIDTSIYNVRDQVKQKLSGLDQDQKHILEVLAKNKNLIDIDGRINKRGLEILNNVIPGGKVETKDLVKRFDNYFKVVSPSKGGVTKPTIKGVTTKTQGQLTSPITSMPSRLSLPQTPATRTIAGVSTGMPPVPPQPPKLQMGLQKTPSTPEGKIDQWKYSALDKLYTEGIDRFNPLSKIAKQAGRDKDMARQLARYYGTGSIADYHLTEELSPILKSVDINDLKKSAIAMRDMELSSRGVKGSPEQVKAQANLQDLSNKLGQEKMNQIRDALKKLYSYQDSMVKTYLVDTGIMSQESYNAMRKNNQFYVPFKRVMDDVDEMLGIPVKRGAGSVGKQNVIFGIKGSEKDIVDPIESIVENTYKLVSLGERQKTARVIASLGEQLPGLIKRVSTGDSKNTVGLFESGKKVFYEVPEEVADAARGMSEESLNTLVKILKLPTDVFRTMTTGVNPEFLMPNVSRDLQTAFFNAGVNPLEWIAGIAHYVRGDQVYKDFLKSGGRTSIISANKQAIVRTAQDLASNKGFSIKSPSDLWRGFEILGQFSEQPTRIASFKKIYDRAIKSGLSPEEALQDAAIAAQDTTINFARRGSKTQSINAVYAYLNARMQGVDKMLRTIKNEPGKAAARFGIGLLAPSLALYAWNNKFESYYDPSVVSERDKTDNFIFMLSDKRGGIQYLKIPKAEVGKIVNPVEEFLDFAREKDANIGNSIKSLLTSFLPVDYMGGLVPTAIQPLLENAINKDLYTGYDLVPQYKQNYPRGYQDSPYTSPIYRAVGQKTGQSPAKLQNLVEGYLGGMARGAEMITRPLVPQKYVSSKNEAGAPINRTFILRRFAGGEKKSVAEQAKSEQSRNEALQTQINTIRKQQLLGNFGEDVADKEIAKLEKQMVTEKGLEAKSDKNYYQFINSSGDLETIDIREPISEPKLTGQTELDKKLKSKYKGQITSRINDIVKLYEAGKLTQDEAESKIKELKSQSAKVSGGKKPKKIIIKAAKVPKVSFKLAKATKMTPIKSFSTKKRRLSLKNYKPKKIVV